MPKTNAVARPTVAACSGYTQYGPFFEKQAFGDQARSRG